MKEEENASVQQVAEMFTSTVLPETETITTEHIPRLILPIVR